jgi:hypothetical protein
MPMAGEGERREEERYAQITWTCGCPCATRVCHVFQVNPTAIFVIEGTGQLGLANNWGDGTYTDETLINAAGVQSARPFFTTLLKKPYRKQVGIAPHFYPPSVSTQTVGYVDYSCFLSYSWVEF